MDARQKQADLEIDRFFTNYGHTLTDSVEREMMQRVVSRNWISQT